MSETANGQKEEKADQFSDVEDDLNDSFAVNINFIKNQTTTSNFRFNINIQSELDHHELPRKSRSGITENSILKEAKHQREKSKNLPLSNQTPTIENKALSNRNVNDDGSVADSAPSGRGELESKRSVVEGDKEDGKSKASVAEDKAEDKDESERDDDDKKKEDGDADSMNASDDDDGIEKVGKIGPHESIPDYYEKLRQNFAKTGVQWEDPDFSDDPALFCTEEQNPDGDFEIEFERPSVEEDNLEFYEIENTSVNIDYEFKVARGILNDKFFIGALMMLFRKREEFFTDLVVDFEHAKENLKAGFCGFMFFINGEWRTVTIDTRLPVHQRNEFSLSKSLTQKAPFWISLFEKAYSKIFNSYTVLSSPLLKDFLVDFTGGWSKMIKIPRDHLEDKQKKFYYDEIRRCLNQGYLIGCMKNDESKIIEELNESVSDKDQGEEEQILSNSIYSVIDLQEFENHKLIYLINHWDKGKVTHNYGPEDEQWETNKKLTETLQYTVSTSDGTFWMIFEEWLSTFNTMYYCRIFPDSWSEYDIAGVWEGDSSGGEPQKTFPWKPEQRIGGKNLVGRKTVSIEHKTTAKPGVLEGLAEASMVIASPMKKQAPPQSQLQTKVLSSSKQVTSPMKPQGPKDSVVNLVIEPKQEMQLHCDFKRSIITDTEDCFFLNPQYKIELNPGNKLIISLMQEDKKMSSSDYIKCNFLIIYVKGRHTRVWDIFDNNIVKKAIDENDDGKRREIVMLLDYNETVRRINAQNPKKLPKNERLYLNLIPYMEFSDKYEIEKKGNQRIFKPYHPEALYWLRIFSNEHIYVNKLKPPCEVSVCGTWTNEVSSGGPRFIPSKTKIIENHQWPINPQYLLKFNNNVRTKIILRKVTGRFANEETNVGLLITKPTLYEDDSNSQGRNKQQRNQDKKGMKIKLEPIERIIKSTNKILEIKPIQFDKLLPKLSINNAEMIYESSFSNNYSASIQTAFSRLDSPIIVIPTLATCDSSFDYKLTVYSTKPTELFGLYNENCTTLIGDWNEDNAGGSFYSMDDSKKDGNAFTSKRYLTWLDNPKFLLQFDSKDWIKDLEFEVVISRVESIWKRRLSCSLLNAMMSLYIFKYDREKWKDNAIPVTSADFMPKNEVKVKFTESKADPKGYLLMPVTYGKDIYGPFAIMVKCNEKFRLTKFTG